MSPFEILAITFTNKAADEMRHRVGGPRRSGGPEDVGVHVPLRLRAHPAPRRQRAWGTQLVHHLRPGRRRAAGAATCCATSTSTPSGFRPRSVHAADQRWPRTTGSASTAISTGRRATFEKRKVADVYREYQAAAAGRPAPWTSTICWAVTVRAVPHRSRCARLLSASVPSRARRRVPGHQPGAERAGAVARRHPSQRVRGGRLRPVDLRVPGCGHPQHLGVRVGLPRRHRRSCSIRTTAAPRASSTPPTRSSPTTCPGNRRTCGPTRAGRPHRRFHGEDESDEARWVGRRSPGWTTRASALGRDRHLLPDQRPDAACWRRQLLRQGVPYQVVGGTRFYDRREVKDALAYVRRSSTRSTRCRSSGSSTCPSVASATPSWGGSTPTPGPISSRSSRRCVMPRPSAVHRGPVRAIDAFV